MFLATCSKKLNQMSMKVTKEKTLESGFVGIKFNFPKKIQGHSVFYINSLFTRKDKKKLRREVVVFLSQMGNLPCATHLESCATLLGVSPWRIVLCCMPVSVRYAFTHAGLETHSKYLCILSRPAHRARTACPEQRFTRQARQCYAFIKETRQARVLRVHKRDLTSGCCVFTKETRQAGVARLEGPKTLRPTQPACRCCAPGARHDRQCLTPLRSGAALLARRASTLAASLK